MWRGGAAVFAAGFLLVGCSGYGELRSIVADATPPDALPVGKCQEFGVYGIIDDPVYGCAHFVRGTRTGVTAGLVRHLEQAGFDVRCQEASYYGLVELSATRGPFTVTADVSRRGSLITMSGDQPLDISDTTRFIRSPYRVAPAGHVILKLEAGRYEWSASRWRRCADVVDELD
jgi:hypothetical protein